MTSNSLAFKVIYLNILVFGAGAIGSTVGGLLHQNGENVVLLGRESHVDKINQDGLKLIDLKREKVENIKIHAIEKLDSLEWKPELILLTVKTQDIRKAAEQIQRYKVPVVTMQNGVRADSITSQFIRKESIIGCVIHFSAVYLEAGKVQYIREGKILQKFLGGMLTLGKPFVPNDKTVLKITQTLGKALPINITNNIKEVRYQKLILNLLINSIPALTGLTFAQFGKNYSLSKIASMILKEGIIVVYAAHFQESSLLKWVLRLPSPLMARVIQVFSGQLDQPTSTLQSILRGKKTEIEYLNGEIIRLGEIVGIPTPYNRKVVKLIKNIEKRSVFFSEKELIHIFNKLNNVSY